MRHLVVGAGALLLAVPWTLAGQDPAKPGGSPAEQIKALLAEYAKAQQEYTQRARTAKTPEERQAAANARPNPQQYVGRLMALAEKDPKSEAAGDAFVWVLQNTPAGPQADRAVEAVAQHHLSHPRLGNAVTGLRSSRSPSADKLLRTVLEKAKDKEAQAAAAYTLAVRLKTKADQGDKSASKEAEELFERVEKEFPEANRGSFAKSAKAELFELRNLAIGKVAPDIAGEDLDGKRFKLSDYRGKVVVLDFWGNW